MNVCFIQKEMREAIGVMLMSANLKKAGHSVEVFISSLPIPELEKFDIFCFSSSTISFSEDLKKATIIKGFIPNAFIIFGGPHPTYNPEQTIKHDCIDAICIGEGLDAIVELANDIDRINKTRRNIWKDFNIQNIWVKIGSQTIKNPIRPISNINDWPRPDYDLYYKKYPVLANKATKGVYIVRGCPYKCAFCYNPSFNEMYKGCKIFQCMDVDKAISEIKWLKDNYGFKWLQFISDNMTINKKWLKEFMKAYRETINESAVIYHYGDSFVKSIYKLPIPFLMNCRANEVTREIVDVLKESGCNRVDFGVEHGNDFIRNDILKRNMSKQQIIQCGRWFKDAGIRVQTTNIFGLPHEDFDKAWESVELNREFIPEISKACILQPFENTDVYNYAKEKGLLKNDMKYSGTTFQIGVKDKRSDNSKIIIQDESKVIRLSYLFDWFVKNNLPKWIARIICSLPLDRFYKKYYAWIFKQQENKYV
jgi:radical SAM superfamily enzyme YgiQ (UPF0313 family)